MAARGEDTTEHMGELIRDLEVHVCRAYSGNNARDVVVAEHNSRVLWEKYRRRVPSSRGLGSALQPLDILPTLDAAGRVSVSPYGRIMAKGEYVRLKVDANHPFVWVRSSSQIF